MVLLAGNSLLFSKLGMVMLEVSLGIILHLNDLAAFLLVGYLGEMLPVFMLFLLLRLLKLKWFEPPYAVGEEAETGELLL